jgi:hypothetical protein
MEAERTMLNFRTLLFCVVLSVAYLVMKEDMLVAVKNVAWAVSLGATSWLGFPPSGREG